MNKHAECDECRVILEELRSVIAEIEVSKLKDEWQVVANMIGGTEEDAERAEEVLGKFQLGSLRPGTSESRYPTIRDVFRRMFEHRIRSGHKPASSNM